MIVTKKRVITAILSTFLLISRSIVAQPVSLNLEKCIEQALKNNFELKMQQQQVKYTQAKENEARSHRLPHLDFETSYLRFSEVMKADISENFTGLPFQIPPTTLRFGDEDNYSLKLSLLQPIYTGGKISNSIKAGKEAVSAELSHTNRVKNDLIYQVKETYYNLLTAQQKKRIAELSHKVIQAHRDDLENMHLQGLVPKNEVLKADIKLAEVDLMVLKANNGIDLLRTSLLNLMGMDLNTAIALDDALSFEPLIITQEDALQTAFEKRPELRALDFSISSLKHVQRAAQGDYWPMISLIGNYEYGKPGLNKLQNEWMDYWTVGVVAKWKLWDWGETRAKVAQSRASLDKLTQNKYSIQNAIRLDIDRALIKKKEALESVDVYQKIKTQAEENYRLVKDRFHQGLETNSEFLDAETQLTKSRIEELTAIAEYQIAVANLERAMGRLSVSE